MLRIFVRNSLSSVNMLMGESSQSLFFLGGLSNRDSVFASSLFLHHMKRFLLSLFFAATSLILGAQSNHMTFKGVPIDGSLDAYVKNMQKAGFTYLGKDDGIAILTGDFAGFRNCKVGVVTLKSLDLVNRISVLFETRDKWADVYAVYSQLKEMLSAKYGKASQCVEEFQGYTQPHDDNAKMHELNMDRCVYSTVFSVDSGDIELEIMNQGFGNGAAVRLSYWDKINTASVQQKAMDDL